MNKNLRCAFAFLLGTLVIVPSSFAQPKIEKPGKNDVVVVTRISMAPALNLDHYWGCYENFFSRTKVLSALAKTQGGGPTLSSDLFVKKQNAKMDRKKEAESWIMAYPGGKWKEMTSSEYRQISQLGEFSVLRMPIPKDRTIYLERVWVFLFGNLTFSFGLPIEQKIVIPEGANYVYIGSLDYVTKGDFLEVTAVNRRDEYDLACDFVHKNYGEAAQLVRVNLLDPDK
jgi:hypothetical protein